MQFTGRPGIDKDWEQSETMGERPTQGAQTAIYIIIMDFPLTAQQGGSLHV